MELITPYVNDYLATTTVQGETAQFVGIEVNPSNGVQSIPVVYGYRRVDGIRLYTFVNGTELLMVVALSEGYCAGLNAIYIDDQKVDIDVATLTHRTPRTVGSGIYSGIATFEFVDGRGSAHPNAAQQLNVGPSQLLSLSGKTVNYTNLCYIACKFTYSGAQSPFKDVPKVSVDLFGRFIPGFLSTSNNYTSNPGYILWDLLQHPIYGRGITSSQIDTTSFTNVIDTCNALISNRALVNYKTFTADWIMDTSVDFLSNINLLFETFNVSLNYVQGKWTASIEASPTGSDGSGGGLTFDENSILGSVSIQYPSNKERYNRVVVDYPDKDFNFQMRSTQFPADGDTTFLTEDGNVVLETRFTTNLCTDYYHANDLAQMILRKSRGQLIYRFTASKIALRCRVGDFIFINTAYPYINNQKVVVVKMTMNPDFTFELECALSSTGFYPATFSNTVKSPGRGTQAISGISGLISAPTRGPLLPPEPLAQPQYQVSADKSIYTEGQTITLTVNSSGVSDGTVIRFQLRSPQSSVTTADVSGASLTGTLTINSNTATKTYVIAEDAITEGDEFWQFLIFNNTTGDNLAFCFLSVKDTSVAPPPPFYLYTITGMPTFGNGDWYLGFTASNSNYIYDSAETTSTSDIGIRTTINNTRWAGNTLKSTYDIEVGLVDRLYSSIGRTRQIFVVCDLQTSGSPAFTYAKKGISGIQVNEFNYLTPPSGANALRSTRLSPAPVVLDELINATATTATNIPGCHKMTPILGRSGQYALTGTNAIKVGIRYGSNQNATLGQSFTTFEYTLNTVLVPGTNPQVRLRFFELDPITYAISEIGTKLVTIGLTTGFLTAKYISQSRTNLKATSKLTSSPF